MPNYGDVALNLSPNWNRQLESDRKFALWIVGHDGGISDAALKSDMDARHQFAWIDPVKARDELAINLSSGFKYVTSDLWDINETLWQWNAEGKCYNQGQLLMARPAALWFAQKAAVEREIGGRKDQHGPEGDEIARRAGLKVERVDD